MLAQQFKSTCSENPNIRFNNFINNHNFVNHTYVCSTRNIQFIRCIYIYRHTVCRSKQTCDVVEALLSKWPCQEDGSKHEDSEHEDSDPDDNTDSSKNNLCNSQVFRRAVAAIVC